MNPRFAIGAGGLTFLAAIAIGSHFWWQLRPQSEIVAGSAIPALPTTPSAAAAAPIDAAPATVTDGSSILAGIPEEPRALETGRSASPVDPPESPIRLRQATTERVNDPVLDQAWQALRRGEIDHARTAWRHVLRNDSRNPDALHGLATIAQLEGQTTQAVDYHLRALEADPKDALALAGLASLIGQADVQQAESRIKTLLAEQPESSYLNFALGNLYAQGSRWAEAQQAYFRAHAADPANPDYLYNLAVSLDQLHQPRHAAGYYEQALAAASRQAVSFDPALAAARLKTLRE